ncbi:hypothetical protein GPJ56_010515 [Histomonas meleagridis]|uniref:uncharacterized protein n=1 Tax=Histomonas meleagridis TaxID=135588 RepID=UPI00355AA360|nr:hypothetical protein GPJ56_010515 [Histomonas meleagridis]KAH0799817.1 hypothetical protein GO595_007388 [Histomonas meleagridis]
MEEFNRHESGQFSTWRRITDTLSFGSRQNIEKQPEPIIKQQLPFHFSNLSKSKSLEEFTYNLHLILISLDELKYFPYDLFSNFNVHEELNNSLKKPLLDETATLVLTILGRYYCSDIAGTDGVELLFNSEYPSLILQILKTGCSSQAAGPLFAGISKMLSFSDEYCDHFLSNRYYVDVKSAIDQLENDTPDIEIMCVIKSLFMSKAATKHSEQLLTDYLPIVFDYSKYDNEELQRKVYQTLRHAENKFPEIKTMIVDNGVPQSKILQIDSNTSYRYLKPFLYFLRQLCYHEESIANDLITPEFFDHLTDALAAQSDSWSPTQYNPILIDIGYIFFANRSNYFVFVNSPLFSLIAELMFSPSFLLSVQSTWILSGLLSSKDKTLVQTALDAGTLRSLEKMLQIEQKDILLELLDSLISFLQMAQSLQIKEWENEFLSMASMRDVIVNLTEYPDEEVLDRAAYILKQFYPTD